MFINTLYTLLFKRVQYDMNMNGTEFFNIWVHKQSFSALGHSKNPRMTGDGRGAAGILFLLLGVAVVTDAKRE